MIIFGNKVLLGIAAVLLVTLLGLNLSSCSTDVHALARKDSEAFRQTLLQAAYNNSRINANRSNSQVPKLITNELTPKIKAGQGNAEQRFNFSVKDADARSFFINLASGIKGSIVVGPNVSGKITLSMKDVTVPQILKSTHSLYGYQYRKTTYGYEVLSAKLETEIFTVNHLNIDRAGQSALSTTGSSNASSQQQGNQGNQGNQGYGGRRGSRSSQSDGLAGDQSFGLASDHSFGFPPEKTNSLNNGSVINTTTENHFWRNLRKTIRLIINAPKNIRGANLPISHYTLNNATVAGNTGDAKGTAPKPRKEMPSVEINPLTGIVVVRAYPDALKKVEQFLAVSQSISSRQVLIEAKFLEVELSNKFKYGLDWSLFGVSGQGETGSSSGFNNATVLNTAFSNVFKVQSHASGFSAVLSLLSTQGTVSVLSSPRISTMNNVKAVIKVGADQYYVNAITGESIPTTTTSASYFSNVSLQPYFSGVSLDVTPQINANGQVTLHIHPTISKVSQSQVEVVSNGQISNIPTALTTVRESDSVVRADSGQVIIIGGLMQQFAEGESGSIPGFDKNSLTRGISNALGTRSSSMVRNELVILLRPVVIKTGTWSEELKKTARHIKGVECIGSSCENASTP